MSRPKDQRPTVRLSPSGKSFYIRYRDHSDNGKEKRKRWPATGPKKVTKTEAQRDANQIAGHLNTAEAMNSARMLFKDLAALWLDCKLSADLSANTKTLYGSQLKPILETFGEMTLGSIERHAVQVWTNTCKQSRSTAAARLRIFKSIWIWAEDMNLWDGKNPCKKIKPGGHKTERPGALDIDGWPRIIEEMEKKYPDTALLLRLCVATGCRVNEALGVRWEKIDLLEGRLLIDQQIMNGVLVATKWDEKRSVDIGPLIPRLSMLNRGEWLFEKRNYDLHRQRLSNVKTRLGIKCVRFGFHTGRRTMATEMDKAGVPIQGIARQLGHRPDSLAVTASYSRAEGSAAESSAVKAIQERVQ